VLAGYELESGADRVDLPEPSPQGLAAAEAYANRLAAEDGVRYLDVSELEAMLERASSETVYLVDVRTASEYANGHIPGFQWFPGGQAVQRSDEVAVVKNCPIVFACDGKARATIAASWYRQLGHQEVYAVAGGVTAWTAAGKEMESGASAESFLGLAEAQGQVRSVSPQDLDLELKQERAANPAEAVIFVDTSADFARGHVPGTRWAPRGWLELQIGGLVPAKETPVTVTCGNGQNSTLAAATLQALGYSDVSVLAGGMAAWRQAGRPEETGLSGVMSPPTDLVPSGPDRNYADMMNYLRWETALGEKYAG
jgi:rhodanese-related sulfurtransferase